MTPAEMNAHATRLLKTAEKNVAIKVSPKAVEHTGVALFEALRKYDPSHGTVDTWVGYKVPLIVKDILRGELGREGSARKSLREITTALGDQILEDAGADENTTEEGEEYDKLLQITSSAPREIKRFLAARLIANPPLKDCDLARILNTTPSRISQQALKLPGFLRGLRSGRLPDAVGV